MRLIHVTIEVKDHDKALEFYTQKMGFVKKADYTQGGPRYLTVSPDRQDIEFVLWPAGAGGRDRHRASNRRGTGRAWSSRWRTSARRSRISRRRGVRFKDAEPLVAGWGLAADLTDPDGNPLKLFQPAAPQGALDWKQSKKYESPKLPSAKPRGRKAHGLESAQGWIGLGPHQPTDC